MPFNARAIAQCFHGASLQPGEAPSTFWSYKTPDTLADINTAGYFNAYAELLKVNDLIWGITGLGGTVVHAFYIVNANSGGVVDVTDGLVITATDTD